jgi:hypothetical protein
MKTLVEIAAYLFAAQIIFSIFFLACRLFSCYILPLVQTRYKKYKAMKQIETLIKSAKGKFFTIKFEKLDGTVRTINAKNRYNSLIKGTGSPATDALKEKGYKNAINRNSGRWFSFLPEKVIEFKCGAIHETF